MFKCLTNQEIDLNTFKVVPDDLDSAASDRIILEDILNTKYICKFAQRTETC